MKKRFRMFGFLAAAALAATFVVAAPATAKPGPGGGFVQRNGATLALDGKPFRFVGTNNYYLMYSSPFMVDDVLNGAAANGFTVMRTWGWLDGAPKNGVWFQNYDGSNMVYNNDIATGLGDLDYAVAKAGALGLKLVIPFTNNWGDFGGMDAYVGWAGGTTHDAFYTDPTIKTWYKAWISHLLNHVNSITGVAYKNDPTIMTWELANEPRCNGSLPASASCTTATLTSWAAEMSAYIKSIDKKHLVSSGSEGFLNIAGSTEYERDGGSGLDELAIASLPTIDVLSYHLYPDGGWNKTVAWGTTWIADHIALAKSIGKPSMLGEFGLKDKVLRDATYQTWTDTVRKLGGTGALFWILTAHNDDGTLYGDFDGFRVTCPSATCTTLANAAIALKDPGLYPKFAPVAENVSAQIDFGQTATLWPAASDIAYGAGNAVVASTIDLDPAAAGQQKTLTQTGVGVFALQANGSVLFTPDPAYFGLTTISYTIQDKMHRVSNVATISVRVVPPPPPATLFYGFESGVQGWGDSWNHPGDVSQSNDWSTQGSFSLKTVAGIGGWYATTQMPTLPAGYSLGDYRQISVDVKTLGSGTSFNIAFQFGSSGWCQGSAWPWISANTETTVTIDLVGASSCAASDLSSAYEMLIYTSGSPVTIYYDNIVGS